MPSTRPRCISCSRILSSWGKTPSGRKRYGCAACKKTRIYQKHVKQTDYCYTKSKLSLKNEISIVF